MIPTNFVYYLYQGFIACLHLIAIILTLFILEPHWGLLHESVDPDQIQIITGFASTFYTTQIAACTYGLKTTINT